MQTVSLTIGVYFTGSEWKKRWHLNGNIHRPINPANVVGEFRSQNVLYRWYIDDICIKIQYADNSLTINHQDIKSLCQKLMIFDQYMTK